MSNFPFEFTCPVCEEKLTQALAVTADGPVTPKYQDITICALCHSLLEFQEDLSPAEIDIKELDPETQDVIAITIAHMQKTRPRVLH